MTPAQDPFAEPRLSALNVLDLLCDKHGWRMQLCSTGVKDPDVGPSELTELRVVHHSKNRGQVAACPLNRPGGAETAARRIVLALQKQETRS